MVAIVGPTASGKTQMAIDTAKKLGAEIISVDSMQVYRGMDIGTAKPTVLESAGVPHHMIDVVDPSEEFSVAEFRRMGRAIMEKATSPLVIVGGSGLHFRSLVDPMAFAPTEPEVRAELERSSPDALVSELVAADPGAGMVVDLANPRRVVRAMEIFRLTGETPSARAASARSQDVRRYVSEVEFTAVGVDPGSSIEARIDQRLAEMRAGGLVEEVSSLRGRMGRTASGAVGYRELLAYLAGEVALEEAFEAIARNTKALARRQRTWFQRDPRIRWIPWHDDPEERTMAAVEVLA